MSRFLSTMLVDVSPRDLATFAAAPAVMILVALLGCYLPARRATRADPVEALRCE